MRALVLAILAALFAVSLVMAAVASNCHVEADGCEGTSDCGACAHDRTEANPASDQKTQVCSVCGESVGLKPVRLQADGTHLYDCIFCALVDGQRRDDYTITADSAVSREAVTLTKRGRSWKASPNSAVALALPSPADTCDGRRLVFASADEFASYVQAHPALATERPKPVPLVEVDQIIEAARPPLPKEAVCPVAKRTIAPDRKTEWTIAKGKVYYFCCAGCKSRFGQ